MNTNSNTYTVIYSTIIVVVVAAVLAFVATALKPMQTANEKAETISQILTAAQFGEKSSWTDNNATIAFYKENIEKAYTVDLEGNENGALATENAEVFSTSDLKAQNYAIRDAADAKLPVYVFKNGTKVIPIYGAGLWGPVWGYIAVGSDNVIAGAYFDHASETPGLGGKIKDDPAFRAQFVGKVFDFSDLKPFAIVKGGAPADKANAIDAITGATMTSNGVEAAVNTWAKAYETVLKVTPAEVPADTTAAAEEVAFSDVNVEE
ncbi:MAG: NADH:ubiquinone reductase (Na(+)-transporting) subunit C [Bacteroidales bacterium]|nr:NADH:ubiquinone reductase (Na(+)-transporting) subunit C [Bacteroidales bacterium]